MKDLYVVKYHDYADRELIALISSSYERAMKTAKRISIEHPYELVFVDLIISEREYSIDGSIDEAPKFAYYQNGELKRSDF